MRLYRFSPINDKKHLLAAVRYVSIYNTKLCKMITGKKLPIKSLTIFSHYQKEYGNLTKILFRLGKLYNENNGPRVALKNPIKVNGNTIATLRIRKPDPYRMQVGCSDFEINNYNLFKKKYLKKHSKNLRLIKRPEYEMVEFYDPNFDVLGYIVSTDLS